MLHFQDKTSLVDFLTSFVSLCLRVWRRRKGKALRSAKYEEKWKKKKSNFLKE